MTTKPFLINKYPARVVGWGKVWIEYFRHTTSRYFEIHLWRLNISIRWETK